MSIDFQCRSFGKCILVGEHAVLRGHPALVVPIQSRFLELTYARGENPLTLRLVGDHGPELQALVWSVLDRACRAKNILRDSLTGTLLLESSLPVGAGMGASAALCVALTRWLGFLGYVSESEYYDFARELENLFHGESSGLDIAVALKGEALKFLRHGDRTVLTPRWQPRWYISYSGQRGITIDAVNKVKDQLQKNPARAKEIDARMAEAVFMAEKALLADAQEGFPVLAKAFQLAASCFDNWGLNEGAPAKHIAWLKDHGAAAVKPTGSGGGGYVLSLWEKEPPQEIKSQLILL